MNLVFDISLIPLGINACSLFRHLACFSLHKFEAKLLVLPIFSCLFEMYVCFPDRPVGKEVLSVIQCSLVAILLLWGCSIFCWQVILSCGLIRVRALWAWVQAFGLDLNITLLNFAAENSIKGTVFFIISPGYSFTPCSAVSSGAFTHTFPFILCS